MNIKRKEDESQIDYLLRLVGYKIDDGEDLDWAEIVQYCALEVSPESLRKAMQPKEVGAYAIYKYLSENGVDKDALELLEDKKAEVKIEVQKLRDLRAGHNEKLRMQSRKESILEEVRQYIGEIETPTPPKFRSIGDYDIKMIGGVADAHFGKDVVIKGLLDEDLNVYNEEIFYKRMENLMSEYIDIIQEEGVSKLFFFELSDSIEGILRMSGLQHIKYGIVESAVKYAKYMIQWLNKLSEYVEIDYYSCMGNHNELRVLASKSGEFAKENMQIVIDEMLKLGLSLNERVRINDGKALQYVNIDGYKVLASHGQEERNLVSSVTQYKDIYNVDVDLMISGHLHNSKQETASLNTKCVQFPSIIGIDDYSMKLKKTAKAEGKAILIKGNRFVNIDIEI